jgi:hypothetical protein
MSETVTPPQGVPKKKTRLQLVAEDQGMTVDEMLNKYATDSVVPGICVKCNMVHDSCEPDAVDNWCDECDAGTVKSILVIAGVI